MSVTLNDNLKVNAPKVLDERCVKPNGSFYESKAEVLSLIPESRRALGLLVIVEGYFYYFKDGITLESHLQPIATSNSTSGVSTVTGNIVDNTDPENPVVEFNPLNYDLASFTNDTINPFVRNDQLEGKVDKEPGKGLSTNDYTTDEKSKLENIEAGAQVNTIERIFLNDVEVEVENKTALIYISTGASTTILDWTSAQEGGYILNAVVFYNNALYRSDIPSNTTNPDTGDWTKIADIGGGGGEGVWGSITGTLSDQEDLQEELDSKWNREGENNLSVYSSDGTTKTVEIEGGNGTTIKPSISIQGAHKQTVIGSTTATADTTVNLPNRSGTLALIEDVTSEGRIIRSVKPIVTHISGNQYLITVPATSSDKVIWQNPTGTVFERTTTYSYTADIDISTTNRIDCIYVTYAGVMGVQFGGESLQPIPAAYPTPPENAMNYSFIVFNNGIIEVQNQITLEQVNNIVNNAKPSVISISANTTLSSLHENKIIEVTDTCTLTIPPGLAGTFLMCFFIVLGGSLTIVGGSGVNITGYYSTTIHVNERSTLIKRSPSSNNYLFI